MLFEPVNQRFQSLRRDSDDGNSLLDYFIRRDLSDNSNRAAVAVSLTADLICYLLLGLWEEVCVKLPEITRWTTMAIENDESTRFPNVNWHRSGLYEARALQGYLKKSDPCSGDWDHARDWWLQTLRDPDFIEASSKSYLKTEAMDQYLALCIHSKRYEDGVKTYHEYCGELKKRLSQIRTPRDFGYAVCMSALNGESFSPALRAAGDRVLSRNIEDLWLGYGQWIRTASWLKIYYDFSEPELAGVEAIRKAYDHMPNVQRPDFM